MSGQISSSEKQTRKALQYAPAAEGARDVLLDAVMDEEDANRLILSNAYFFDAPRAAVRRGILHPFAAERIAQIRKLFPDDEIKMFMALRYLAPLLPEMFEHSPKPSMTSYLGVDEPCDICWSDTIHVIRNAVPHLTITVWCNEDTQLLWPQIVHELAGLELSREILDEFDLLNKNMSKEGMQRFAAYLKLHPVMTKILKRRVIFALLNEFALEEKIEEELTLAGWTKDLMDDMTDVCE